MNSLEAGCTQNIRYVCLSALLSSASPSPSPNTTQHNATMKVVRPVSPARRLPSCQAIAILILTLSVCLLLATTPLPHRRKPYHIECIKFSPKGQTREGIGAVLRRNQFGLFLADTYDAKVAFPKITSEHGYEMDKMFDTCPEPSEKCTIREADLILYRCPRSDCACHRQQIAPYMDRIAASCKVVLFVNQQVRTMEYSGCTDRTLRRYFGTEKTPVVPYDALHYRAGDLAGRKGGKTFSPRELFYLLNAMCRLSTRDIVVCTEGTPNIPIPDPCKGRLVLASDTSMQDVFRIFQHAKTVAVGTSSLATMVMEIARPERVVMLERVLPRFEWVDCEQWTLIEKMGAVFHFKSKSLMVDAALSGRPLMIRSLRTDNQHSSTRFREGVPERRWSNDSRMSWARKVQS